MSKRNFMGCQVGPRGALLRGRIAGSRQKRSNGGVEGEDHPAIFLERIKRGCGPPTDQCFLLENNPIGGGENLGFTKVLFGRCAG